jgi:hypothetical protein
MGMKMRKKPVGCFRIAETASWKDVSTMVFHNAISFASNDKEPQKLIHHHHPLTKQQQ